jgi:hypothetical protein
MRRNALVRFAALLVVLPALVAWSRDVVPLDLGADSRLWISGTSTVRAFTCKAAIVDATIEDSGPGAVAAVLKGEKAVRAVTIAIPAGKLDCGNGKMNDHMLKALKSAEHPTITFKLSSYDLVGAANGMQASLTGELTLGGVTKTITMKADGKKLTDGVLDVTGTHEIRMTEYGLKPPTLMMGALKVNEKVQVSFQLFLKEPTAVVAVTQ